MFWPRLGIFSEIAFCELRRILFVPHNRFEVVQTSCKCSLEFWNFELVLY